MQPMQPMPLRLTLHAGRGRYDVRFDAWSGAPLTDSQAAQLHVALDRALLAINATAARGPWREAAND